MNYIHKLQARIAELEGEVAATKERDEHIVAYLTSSKFQGFDHRDGSLNSRVEVADILHRLGRL